MSPANAAPPIPWVDLDGNPITDTRPYPTATATDAGIEIRLGEREWLLADEKRCTRRASGLRDFRPIRRRSRDRARHAGLALIGPTVLELLPDGTIERYFVDGWSTNGTARRLVDRRTRSPTGPPHPSSLTSISSPEAAQTARRVSPQKLASRRLTHTHICRYLG